MSPADIWKKQREAERGNADAGGHAEGIRAGSPRINRAGFAGINNFLEEIVKWASG